MLILIEITPNPNVLSSRFNFYSTQKSLLINRKNSLPLKPKTDILQCIFNWYFSLFLLSAISSQNSEQSHIVHPKVEWPAFNWCNTSFTPLCLIKKLNKIYILLADYSKSATTYHINNGRNKSNSSLFCPCKI